MKYIKIQDTVVIFDEMTNHGFMASVLGNQEDVQSAGFVKMFPTADNVIRQSVGGRSTTLKIDSTPADKEIIAEQFKMSADQPTNFISSDSTLILFPDNAPFDVIAAMKSMWPGAEFVHGQISFETVETDDFRYDSGYKAVPHFTDVVGTVSNDLLFTIDFNIRAD